MRSLTTLEIEDPSITQLLPQYQEAASEEARMLNAGLGPNHPNVKALRAKKEVMGRQLAEQTIVLRKTLETNLAIAEQGLANLREKLEATQKNQQDSKTKSAGYYEAKNNWLQARKVLEAAETRSLRRKSTAIFRKVLQPSGKRLKFPPLRLSPTSGCTWPWAWWSV